MSVKISHKPILFCLVGPAGSGKTSLAKRLIDDDTESLKKLISATSRSPRPGEVDGINYHFFTKADFQKKVDLGDFFEWEEIHGNLYGQLKSSLEAAINGEHDIVIDIDIRGAKSIEGKYPKETIVVFLLPPSKQELKNRIISRAPVSTEELEIRMKTAEQEIASFSEYCSKAELIDYSLVNLNFEDTLLRLKGIILSERLKVSRQDFKDFKL